MNNQTPTPGGCDLAAGLFQFNPPPPSDYWTISLLHLQSAIGAIWWTKHLTDRPSPAVPPSTEEELLLETVVRFSKHQKVRTVYCQHYRAEIQIIVGIDASRYDRELMDKLLDDEYDIRRQAGAFILTFVYPPVGAATRPDIVHPKARLLFTR